jgi:hypothetical protein
MRRKRRGEKCTRFFGFKKSSRNSFLDYATIFLSHLIAFAFVLEREIYKNPFVDKGLTFLFTKSITFFKMLRDEKDGR